MADGFRWICGTWTISSKRTSCVKSIEAIDKNIVGVVVVVVVVVSFKEGVMKNPRLDALRMEHILKAVKQMEQGTIRTYAAVVDGEEFPAKQLVREAANLISMNTPKVRALDCNAHDAVRILERLGVIVRTY